MHARGIVNEVGSSLSISESYRDRLLIVFGDLAYTGTTVLSGTIVHGAMSTGCSH